MTREFLDSDFPDTSMAPPSRAKALGQPWYISHAETIAQNVIGQLCAFAILWWWGLPLVSSLKLQLVFFVVAYTRGYLIRRWFNSRRKQS